MNFFSEKGGGYDVEKSDACWYENQNQENIETKCVFFSVTIETREYFSANTFDNNEEKNLKLQRKERKRGEREREIRGFLFTQGYPITKAEINFYLFLFCTFAHKQTIIVESRNETEKKHWKVKKVFILKTKNEKMNSKHFVLIPTILLPLKLI